MTRTCLVVDDSRVTRSVGKQIIESFGFLCDEAVDGEKALEYCRTQLPDVILLDWNMPLMSGYDFLLALRQLPTGRTPVVIFCTSEHDITHITQALQQGANEYIIKPFDSDVMRDKFIQTGLLDE